jgi:hypothetical protein
MGARFPAAPKGVGTSAGQSRGGVQGRRKPGCRQRKQETSGKQTKVLRMRRRQSALNAAAAPSPTERRFRTRCVFRHTKWEIGVTNFVISLTNFIIGVTNFIISVTNFPICVTETLFGVTVIPFPSHQKQPETACFGHLSCIVSLFPA